MYPTATDMSAITPNTTRPRFARPESCAGISSLTPDPSPSGRGALVVLIEAEQMPVAVIMGELEQRRLDERTVPKSQREGDVRSQRPIVRFRALGQYLVHGDDIRGRFAFAIEIIQSVAGPEPAGGLRVGFLLQRGADVTAPFFAQLGEVAALIAEIGERPHRLAALPDIPFDVGAVVLQRHIAQDGNADGDVKLRQGSGEKLDVIALRRQLPPAAILFFRLQLLD